MPWTKLNAGEWMNEVSCLSPTEKCIYVMLRFQMLYTGEPLLNDLKALALYVGYPMKTFIKALDLLLLKKKIISLADGRLWNLDVEAELSDSKEKSESASKAASVRWQKAKNKSDNDYLKEANNSAYNSHMRTECGTACDAHSVRNANNINNNIYKKTNTIVLAKKENFEDSETALSIQEPNGSDALFDTLSAQNEISDADSSSEITDVVKLPPVHEQENISPKAKRAKTDRGCRLPADFEPDYDFAIQEGLPPERVNFEIANFKDHWKVATGKNAVKRDWPATWRVWVRRTVENLAKGNNYGKGTGYQTDQQRGWGHRVAEHIRNIKHSDSAYRFLFEDDARPTIPLAPGTKTIDCRSGASHCLG
ncbi:DUF1376 domain-containing protein [Bartonella sp. B41]